MASQVGPFGSATGSVGQNARVALHCPAHVDWRFGTTCYRQIPWYECDGSTILNVVACECLLVPYWLRRLQRILSGHARDDRVVYTYESNPCAAALASGT
eukprot:symbB.v1.2.002613.t1/scaffold135.1/size305288/33